MKFTVNQALHFRLNSISSSLFIMKIAFKKKYIVLGDRSHSSQSLCRAVEKNSFLLWRILLSLYFNPPYRNLVGRKRRASFRGLCAITDKYIPRKKKKKGTLEDVHIIPVGNTHTERNHFFSSRVIKADCVCCVFILHFL